MAASGTISGGLPGRMSTPTGTSDAKIPRGSRTTRIPPASTRSMRHAPMASWQMVSSAPGSRSRLSCRPYASDTPLPAMLRPAMARTATDSLPSEVVKTSVNSASASRLSSVGHEVTHCMENLSADVHASRRVSDRGNCMMSRCSRSRSTCSTCRVIARCNRSTPRSSPAMSASRSRGPSTPLPATEALNPAHAVANARADGMGARSG